MKSLLEIENIEKKYLTDSQKEVVAIKDLSLSIPKNKLSILLGETGCGKTSLLNIIAGLDSDFKGNIISNYGNLNIAFVFQHYTLFPWRNVINNIAFSLEIAGVKKSKRLKEAAELAKKVGLQGFEKNYPHELSGGMRQRVAIAQSLAKKPDLLLLDEPFGALDNITRTALQNMLIDVMQTEDITIIMITHNIEEGILLGDKIFILKSRPSKIIANYAVSMEYPRDKKSEDFVQIFKKISQALSTRVTDFMMRPF